MSGAPRHRREVVSVAASARWHGDSMPSTRRHNLTHWLIFTQVSTPFFVTKTFEPFLSVSAKAACFRIFWRLALETISPLAQARRREAVLSMDYEPILANEINSLFDVFLLARLIVSGRRSGPLAARRRVLGSKDLSRVIAKFLARKLISEPEQ